MAQISNHQSVPISEHDKVLGPKPGRSDLPLVQKLPLTTESEYGTAEQKRDTDSAMPAAMGLFPAINEHRNPMQPLELLDDIGLSAGGSSVLLQPGSYDSLTSQKQKNPMCTD